MMLYYAESCMSALKRAYNTLAGFYAVPQPSKYDSCYMSQMCCDIKSPQKHNAENTLKKNKL